MKPSRRIPWIRPFERAQGSTILLIILMTASLGLVITSMLTYAHTEARLNQSDLLQNEARFAAEATVNHGVAQLRRRFDRTRQLSPVEMHPGRASSLQLESGFLQLMRESRAVVPTSYSRPGNHSSFLEADTIVGAFVVNNGEANTLRIDPRTHLPEENRPGAPTHAQIREVRIYGKATTADPSVGTRTAYIRQTFQVLDRSLFQNSVFFAGLLEIFPGANFNLGEGNGPIYGYDIRIGNNPRIHTRIETSGEFRIGRYHNSGERGSSAELANFANFDPSNPDPWAYLVDLRHANTGSGALQTGVDNFRELALQAYSGGLLTAEHGVVPQAAVGLEFLRELSMEDGGDYETNGRFDQGKFDREGSNFGHLLIAPSRGRADPEAPENEGADPARLEAFNTIEENKFSNRSALVLEFDPATDEVRIFHQPFQNGEPVFSGGHRVRHEIDIEAVFPEPNTRFWEVSRFEQPDGANTEVTGGLYDFRQGENDRNRASGRINLLRLDVQRMRQWVEEDSSAPIPPSFDDDWWNGGVYVRMPEEANPGREDGVVPADSNWAVQLHSGETIPNRRTVNPDSASGMTLSTNAALYVQGTYNAPGGTSWEMASFGLEAGVEAPAALVADAIMLLSDSWSNRDSGRQGLGHRLASNTVFSAALIMGNVPSTSTGQYSGGLENFPRLLEQWSGRTLTYRGSLIRLFRSESFNAPWQFGGNIYNAPNRDWHFHTGYRELSPPLDLGPRTYRRIFFRELTADEFAAETASLFQQ